MNLIPILWRSLLQGYVRAFFLSVSTFLAVLLVTRFKEIARFTALSGDWSKTFFFTAYQFPLILPIAIPLSALIASILLFQRLSRTHELTAMRSFGFSFCRLLTPLLFASALLAIGNFSICAEIAPFCRSASKAMLYNETSTNPLLLLQRQQLIKLKHAYFNMKIKEEGRYAKDVLLIAYNEAHQRLGLFSALELSIDGPTLEGKHVALVSHLVRSGEAFDSIFIDNQAVISMQASLLSQSLKKHRPRLEAGMLSMRMLLLRTQLENKKLASAAQMEILRRITLSLSVFSFTFLGCAFGIEVGRRGKSRLAMTLLLVLMILIPFLTIKELKGYPLLAALVSLLPHPIVWLASALRLRRISQGCME